MKLAVKLERSDLGGVRCFVYTLDLEANEKTCVRLTESGFGNDRRDSRIALAMCAKAHPELNALLVPDANPGTVPYGSWNLIEADGLPLSNVFEELDFTDEFIDFADTALAIMWCSAH